MMKAIQPVLIGVAAALATVLLFVSLQRLAPAYSMIVVLPRGEWRCTASHEERTAVARDSGGIQFVADSFCDQWTRR